MFGFFKTPAHRKFEHTPIYFDQEKDDLKRRVEAAEGQRSRLSQGALRDRWARNHDRMSAQNKASNIRMLVIIAILSFIVWWIFFSK